MVASQSLSFSRRRCGARQVRGRIIDGPNAGFVFHGTGAAMQSDDYVDVRAATVVLFAALGCQSPTLLPPSLTRLPLPSLSSPCQQSGRRRLFFLPLTSLCVCLSACNLQARYGGVVFGYSEYGWRLWAPAAASGRPNPNGAIVNVGNGWGNERFAQQSHSAQVRVRVSLDTSPDYDRCGGVL
jgi:hypothetical protein